MIDANSALNSDWLKTIITTLIGAVVGFMSAMASEVWKSNRATRKRVNALERALYAEMAQLYEQIQPSGMVGDNDHMADINATLIKQFRTDSYKFAKSNPDLFYSLRAAFVIDDIYHGLYLAQTIPTLDSHKVCLLAYGFVAKVRISVTQKELNIELLEKAAPETYELILANIKADAEKYPEYHKSIAAGESK